jgi:catechol 2,3-dioxygenase-like lactoylglutathione lyase family enzyme
MAFERIAPVFPVSDIDQAIEHYRRLGFSVQRYEGSEPYAYAQRDGVELHLTQVDDLKPKRNMSAVYLYVDDADALFREWSDAGTDGRVLEPSDTSYGLREGACLDRDANLIRFGSVLDRRG